MKILLISQYFWPVKGAAAKRTGKMAQFLSEAGHSVTVLTGFPSYPNGILQKKYKGKLWMHEKLDNINIIRTYELPAGVKDSAVKRLINMVSFAKSAAATVLFMGKFDGVIVSSPSLLSGIAGLWAKKKNFYFDVRDLWPDSAIDMGLISKTGFLTRLAERLEKNLYKKSCQIFTATPGIKNHLISEGIDENKIEVLLNSVDTEVFSSDKANLAPLGYNSNDFVCGYVGNMSRVYDLETVIKAAEILKDQTDIKFLFLGEGENKDKLKQMAQNLPNVMFKNERSINEIAPIIASFSVGLVPLISVDVTQQSFPSKISEYFSCSKPVIASIGGDMAKIIKEHAVGLFYNSGDPESLSKQILAFYNNRELIKKMGVNARTLACSTFSDQIFKDKFLKALD